MALYTIRSGATAHPEDSVLQLLTDLISEGGVRTMSTVTNDFKVTEKSGTADMSVDIAAGRFFVLEDANCYPVRNTATVNKTVTANSSGNPRKDAVVVYIDLSASPDTTASNVAKLAVVAGTPAASPVQPDDTAIGTAIGASNPYHILAIVSVANGATSIVNANITDNRKRFKFRNENKIYALSYGATITPHQPNGVTQTVTLTGNVVVAEPTGMRGGDVLNLIFTQDGTGSRTITFTGPTIEWFGGTPVFSTTAAKVDSVLLEKKNDSDSTYWGYLLGQT